MTVDQALWEAASKDAGLGVGHIWTEMRCPAYDSFNPDDCNCNRGAWHGQARDAQAHH